MPRSRSTTVVASPAAAAETAICTVGNLTLPPGTTVDFDFGADITVGTAGVTAILRLRRGGDTSGTAVFTSSAFTVIAANHSCLSFQTQDTQPGEFQNAAYTLTLAVGSASAQTTVNNVYLWAIW